MPPLHVCPSFLPPSPRLGVAVCFKSGLCSCCLSSLYLLSGCRLRLALYLIETSKLTPLRSAVNLGYLPDPFLPYLYRPPMSSSHGGSASGAGGPSRKPPLINVGTHHRTMAVDMLVQQFLDRGGRQILSLGAGSDTRFWRLMVRTTYMMEESGS
jgi:hypothetical protein